MNQILNAEQMQEINPADKIGTDFYGEESNETQKSDLTVINDEKLAEVKKELIRAFDCLCRDANIPYFAFGKLLVGCIHYEGLIPGKADEPLDVGLIREDYERLIPVLREKAGKYGLFFDEKVGNTPYDQPVKRVGMWLVIDNPDVHIEKLLWLFISPFDKIPSVRDYQYGIFHRMNLLNDVYKIQAGMKRANRIGGLIKAKLAARFSTPEAAIRKVTKAAARYNSVEEYDIYVRLVSSRSARIRKDQIFPLVRRKFYDFEINTPYDFSPWTVVMDEKLKFQIQSIQKVDLEILAEFDRICRRLGIGYFICGGTMLGSVRHNGFIPWDDDIDVGMLRADYNRFLKEGGKYLSERFFLQTRESDPKIPYLFSKIRVNKTEYITEYNDGRDFHKGICLDLFPFDYVPNDLKKRKQFVDEVLEKSAAHNLISNMCIPEPKNQGAPRNFEDFRFRAERKLRRWYYRRKSLKRSQEAYLKVATRYNDRHEELGLHTVASFVPSYTFIRLDDLLPYKEITFEGVPTKVPQKPEVFLTMQYGDFMQPPLKHQQVGHPLIRWSVNTDEPSAEQQ